MIGIFLDTETNGLDSAIHATLEIALILIDLQTGEKIASYDSLINIDDSLFEASDSASLAYTKITRSMLKQDGKKIDVVKEEILTLFKKYNLQRGKAVFICQNPSFDRVFFSKLINVAVQESLLFPYHWLDLASMFWGKQFPKNSEKKLLLSKDSIAEFYGIEGEKMPHRALQGVLHLIDCYEQVTGFPKKDSLKDA